MTLDAGDVAAEWDGDYSESVPAATRYICVVLFILSTIFTQITMLNMIIAIMGDVFDELMENKQLFATQTKFKLAGTYAPLIDITPTDEELS